MDRIGLGANLDTFNALLACYNQKHRHYHNTTHIHAVLKHLDQSKDLANDQNAVEIALWFHDAIYKPYSSSNELDSANWASDFLQKNRANGTFTKTVHALIMATLHNATLTDNDERLLIDIDLSILGSPPDIYHQFEQGIRQEYQFVPGFLYRKKRKEILNSFLTRKRIFSHDFYYERFEVLARTNIANAISTLSST